MPNNDPSDTLAQRLAEFDVKRRRTVADLDAVRAAARSVQNSMANHPARQDALSQPFVVQLDSDDLPEEQRQQVYQQWSEALRAATVEYNELADERERLHVQEMVLVRMIAELDYQIELAKRDLS